MNVKDNARPGLDENYWQAILDQGEMSAEPVEPDTPELWAGLQEHFADSHPEDDTAHQDADGDNGWAQARMCLETDEVLEIEVTGYNRGGLLVNWHSLSGFVPASHLVGLSPYLDEEERRQELERRVGQYLKLKVIELDSEEERFILSERVTTDEEKRRVCELARRARAHFVKTSTGFSTAGATVADVALMAEVVRGAGMEVKASGGIGSYEDAKAMIAAGATRLGASASIAIVQEARETSVSA